MSTGKNTRTIWVSEEVFERLKRRSVELNSDMKGAIHSVINNEVGYLTPKYCTLKPENRITFPVTLDVFEEIDKIRQKYGISALTVLYCLVHSLPFPNKKQRQKANKFCTQAFNEDYEKLLKIKEGTDESFSEILRKLINNGKEIQYISRW